MKVSETELHIGGRLRAARHLQGISQESLAKLLGVTPEQLQKYEDGEDPIGAGRLYDVARALQVNVSYFYEGLNGETSCPYALSDERYALLRRTLRRIAADHEITDTGHRKKMPRHTAINVAREVCEVLGWYYGSAPNGGSTSIAPADQNALGRARRSSISDGVKLRSIGP